MTGSSLLAILLDMRRRTFLQMSACLGLSPGLSASEDPPIRIGLTPVILDDRVRFLRDWSQWLERELGTSVEIVQRAKYQDIMELLNRQQLDAAWICGYPYVLNQDHLDLLAIPVYQGEPLYHAYILGHGADRGIRDLRDLPGRTFAFSDPLSNSGYLYPVYRFRQLFHSPVRGEQSPFRKSFFAWGHRHVIEAVAAGLADAGAVDGYVWDQLNRLHPELTSKTHIIERSPAFGFPPLVSNRSLDPERKSRLARVFTGMNQDDEGRALLDSLGLDRFQPGSPTLYDSIAGMARRVAETGGNRT